MCKDNPS
jgi:hypothetical protein